MIKNIKYQLPLSVLVVGCWASRSGSWTRCSYTNRTLLYERANEIVLPYGKTVAEFVNRTAELKNRLANCGIKDERIIVPQSLGAENRTNSNILSANKDSLSCARTPPEILRIVYGTGSENKPGGFFPKGAGGNIARLYLSPA